MSPVLVQHNVRYTAYAIGAATRQAVDLWLFQRANSVAAGVMHKEHIKYFCVLLPSTFVIAIIISRCLISLHLKQSDVAAISYSGVCDEVSSTYQLQRKQSGIVMQT
jgi:hypothetical protein